MKILVTGLTGLIGSRFQELLENGYEFEEITSSSGTDILNKKAVLNKISSSEAKVVLHLAAKTNVDVCEKDKERDREIIDFVKTEDKENAFINEKTAYGVNVFGTQNIVDACKKTEKKIIFISTDFVFNGQKKSYTEEDEPDPIGWYAKTKYEAEKVVKNSNLDFIIARTAYPYRAYFERTDFVRTIITKLERNEQLKMITDHVFVPTFIDEIVNALDILIRTEQKGIFHIVGSESITPYNAALKIAEEFELDSSLISKTTRQEYYHGKAQRPFCLNLKNDKIGKLGIEMSTFDMGLKEIKNQMERIHI